MCNDFPILILISLSIVFFQSVAQVNHISFDIDLIHVDSSHSPFYNESISQSELLRRDVQRSHAQVSRSNSSSIYANDKALTTIMQGTGSSYLTRYFLGSEKFKVFAFLSLKRNFIWTRSIGLHQNENPFHPYTSSTFEHIRFGTAECELFNNLTREDDDGNCEYKYKINSATGTTTGVVSKDKISFRSSKVKKDPQSLAILFGCSYENEYFYSLVHGFVGMARGPISLVSQIRNHINHKFSYCLRSTKDKAVSRLKFGNINNQAIEDTMISSPLQLHLGDTLYYLNLEAVSVSGSKFDSGGGIWNLRSDQYPIIIDSGTSMTYLGNTLYQRVEDKVKTIIDDIDLLRASEGFKICFDDNELNRSLLPKMVFHFTNATITMKPSNVFVKGQNNQLCMAIFSIHDHKYSIFGSQAQVNHIIQFDLKEKQISFAETTNCESFES